MTGMTVYDVLFQILKKGCTYLIISILVIVAVYMLLHPQKVREWNSILLEKQAKHQPKKRKRSFERKLNNTVDKAIENFTREYPAFKSNLLPYELKLEWLNGTEAQEPLLDGNQAIIYVNDYKNESNQAVTVINSYVKCGFAVNAKYYTSDATHEAIDLVTTKKVLECSSPYIFEYFNRNFLPEKFGHNERVRLAYDNLSEIDRQGLFLPILMNELQKFACSIYSYDKTDEIEGIVLNFINFVSRIATKGLKLVPTIFNQGGIYIRIILAVSDKQIEAIPDILDGINADISGGVHTIYVLASGSKIPFADQIAERAYDQNIDRIEKPRIAQYKRRGKCLAGVDAICYELTSLTL